MRTLFVCSSRNVNRHAGEEYDDILEVEDQPTTETIQDWANRVRDRVRKLWTEQTQADEEEPAVHIWLDAVTPFNTMLINLQILMRDAEKIKIELPYLESTHRTTRDREAMETIQRLDNKQ